MRLIFVRHGDPEYVHDTLTEYGWKEAEALVPRIAKLDVKEFYVSPLGRAQDTASCSLKALNRTAVTFDWLQEFPGRVPLDGDPELLRAYPDRKLIDGRLHANVSWDMAPAYLADHPEYYDTNGWRNAPAATAGDIVPVYDHVTAEFDRLLAEHGYTRCEGYYRADRANRDTLVFFCHFGLECVLLSHILHISPFTLWHSTCLAPTAVTTVNTEERHQGVASFRAASIGDISHLYAAGLEPSFAARFCETYDSTDERH